MSYSLSGCTRSDVSVDQVLNIKGFDLQRTLATLPGARPAIRPCLALAPMRCDAGH